ncbi:helix-turn-helix domain-containing protein [Actinomycetospora chlora]|uniref:Helix-turn-helix domain-containing protein n=1 Tax=Actinomycetospora chlora TaxID=663608 RepID=A0ABP9A3Z6_9PSEU
MTRTLPEPAAEDLDMTAILGALVDPARRAIMRAMYRGPEPFDCSASTWCETLGITAPTVSHHFRTLREAGLTRTVVEGRTRTVAARREDVERRFPGLLQAVLGPEEDVSG